MPTHAENGTGIVTRALGAFGAAATFTLAACGGDGGNATVPPPVTPTAPEVLPAITVDVGSVGKGGKEIALDQFDPRITSLIVNARTGDVTCAIARNADGSAKLVITPTQDGVEAQTRCTVDGTDNPGKITVEQHADYNVLADTWAPRFVDGKDTVTATGTSDAAGYIILSEKLPVTDIDKNPVYTIDPKYLSKFYHYDPKTSKLSWDVSTSNVPNIPVTITDAAGNTSVGHIVMDIKYVAPPVDPNQPSFCDLHPNHPNCSNY